MRAFVFVAAGAHYAMDASCIRAVHPLVHARPLPSAPPWLSGVIDVHGELVPLIDACQMLGGTPVQRTLGARVLLIDSGDQYEDVRGRFALAVDRVLDPVALDMSTAWRGSSGAAPWLGAVVQHEGNAAQIFDVCAFALAHKQITLLPSGEAAASIVVPVEVRRGGASA